MTHFSAAIVWREEAGEIFFLLQDSKDNRKQNSLIKTRFPGGMNKPPDEDPVTTLRREIKEELWQELKESLPEAVHEDINDKDGHRHIFYLIPGGDLTGDLRQVEIVDGSDRLFPPRWVKSGEVGWYLYETHQLAFVRAMKRIGLMGR